MSWPASILDRSSTSLIRPSRCLPLASSRLRMPSIFSSGLTFSWLRSLGHELLEHEAIKKVAKRKGLEPSTLKRELVRLKTKKPEPYTDEERAAFAESAERHVYVVLVQDEIDSG